ncbi:uncharacterized protein LOC121978433 [Zingiber officinale]|uniref:uncharacterized protein LOC121978433 n=1 Tax=Zingiber officinale TaxID=94328 RepID=UPI001C4CE4FE|nr:uncharacterized protein LOC121978433 [Zingiber officinale]
MPGLSMKRKSNEGCLRLHSVHARQRLTRRSEKFSSQINTEVEISDQCHQIDDGQYSKEIITSAAESGSLSRTTESDGASTLFLNWSSLSPDVLSIETLGSLTTFLTSEEETIFSPNFEDGDSQLANHGDGVKDGTSELPNLVTDEGDNGITGLTDYEACSLLDICFSDSVPSLPFHSCMGFPDVSFHHCELTNSDILIDVAEKYVLLPFPEKIMETSGIHSNESIEEIMLNSDDACFYIATHQEFDMNCQSGDLRETECFNPQLDFRFSHHIQAIPSGCPLLPEIETQERKPITLVLDLDETLVHSSLEHCDDVDFTFSVFFNMKKQTVYVKRRPFLQMFLERVAQMFEIVIFTASLSIYAAQLLDILDPEQRIISRRIYRESCIFSDGCYTKDLTILGVDLAKVVIIDNTPQVFHLQVNNGIPIKSWFDDPSDLALVQLLPFLESLVDADDVRPIIAKKFGNKLPPAFFLGTPLSPQKDHHKVEVPPPPSPPPAFLIITAITAVPTQDCNTQQALQSMAALEEHASLQSANAMPEMDVITPIATVPVVNPTATTTTTPVYNPFPTMTPYSTPASSSSSGQSWCVASQTASQASLQVALDYACGYGGADCSSIQKGGGCFDPDTMRDHASYAFNDYYQRKPNPTSCDFAGTAIITSVDPSKLPKYSQQTSSSSRRFFNYLSQSDRYFDMPLSINEISLLLFCLVIIYIHMQGSLTTFLTSEEETIFSPNFEDGDSQLANHGDGVKDGTSELPNLVTDEGDNGITGLTDYEACSLLDICFSDSVPSLPFHSCMGFPDVSFHHCELTNSDILIDVAEKYVLLPFPEKIMETSGIHSNESIEEIMLNSDDACFYIATHQEFDMNCQSGDLRETECFNPQLDFRFSHHIQAIPSGCPLLPEIETQERKPITLVLDLDETLVHSSLEHCDDVDFTFSVFFNMKKQTVYVKRRPFLQMFLERVAQMFEIVIFTASLSIYAAQLLDILDPEQRIISRRIYRESCIFSDGCYTKDLTILGVDLAKVVIIDNTPQVFHLQVNNGIPIKSWFDDPSDLALVQLLPFLESLVDADDVRPIIAKKFGNKLPPAFFLGTPLSP